MKARRNDPCPCGSGKKYKHCCYAKDSVKHEEPVLEAAAAGEPEADETDGTDEHEADHDGLKRPHRHNKDRARFQGDSRGRSSSFKPRTTRSTQRGS